MCLLLIFKNIRNIRQLENSFFFCLTNIKLFMMAIVWYKAEQLSPPKLSWLKLCFVASSQPKSGFSSAYLHVFLFRLQNKDLISLNQ